MDQEQCLRGVSAPLCAPVAAPPAISCPGFFHTWSFLRVPPLGLLRRSREPHIHSKIYSNESLMTLEGNRQAHEGLQWFSFKTQRFFFFFSKPISGKQIGAEGSWCTLSPAVKTLGAPAFALEAGMLHLKDAGRTLSHPSLVSRCWARSSQVAAEQQGVGEEGMGRRTGQREAAASGLFAAIQKPREIGSLFH